METKNDNIIPALQRRSFLKWGGLSLLSLPYITKVKLVYGSGSNFTSKRNYWATNSEGKSIVYRKPYMMERSTGAISGHG
jgi:hypothetical protein